MATKFEIIVAFKVEAAGKTIEGQMRVPDADGTLHMPMLINGLMKHLAEQLPVIRGFGPIKIEADICGYSGKREGTE